ncbi:MAG: major capsid protein [Microviridae sp.]|nr:MAG: major capsid protein [Microviridae sp.]
MANIFTKVSMKRPKKNVFDLSHEKKLTCNMGDLIPCYLEEVIPGDKFRVNSEIMMRFAPMIAPVMHRVNVYTHYFFVPNRIIYDEWEKFITGGVDGLQIPNFPLLEIRDGYKTYFNKGTLADYFGLPTVGQTGSFSAIEQINALPFRAYQKIYNEYYRDQTLTPEVVITPSSTVIGTEIPDHLKLRKRSWEKDYFTSSLPWAQRGGDVLLPVDNSITYRDQGIINPPPNTSGHSSGTLSSNGNSTGNDLLLTYKETAGTDYLANIDNIESVDTAITINELRRSNQLQVWLEKNARAGSRYVEQLLSHWGVVSSDARLQRPEFLGGGKQPVVISEVLSTFNNETVPGANMYGHGISVGSSNSFTKTFEEHGYIIGIMSVLPRTSYSQGVPKTFSRKDKFDFAWNEFAQIGEQEVVNKELYFDANNNAENQETFGYQSRYSEYKFGKSTLHGDFRDDLSFWTMGRIFTARPNLNASFIESDPTQRIFAVTDPDVHKLYVQIYNSVRAARPLPIFGTPTL